MIVRRMLIAVTVLTFVLVQWSPIDQVQAYVGADMLRVSAEQRAQIEAYWGLDRPPPEQFMRWSQALLQGDLGTSMIYRQPVADVIRDHFFHSAALLLAAWILSGLIGFTLGLIAAMKRHSRLDGAIQWVCYTLAATPAFWFGLLLLVVFAVWLGWFPIGMGIPAGILACRDFSDRAAYPAEARTRIRKRFRPVCQGARRVRDRLADASWYSSRSFAGPYASVRFIQ